MAARDPASWRSPRRCRGAPAWTSWQKRFPARVFDVGIAEQHGVTFAAGLAAGGMRPFCAIYSSFLQRGYDQIVHDVALQNLPVRFAIDRAGLVGQDGATHAGAFDIGFLANLPNMTVMAAGDEADLVHMIATAAAHDRPHRAPLSARRGAWGSRCRSAVRCWRSARGRVMREGEVAILSFGAHLSEALAAADLLAEGLNITVADARFAKPLDTALIDRLLEDHGALVTLEQGASGGFGAQVLHYLAASGGLDRGRIVRTLMLPDRFIDQEPRRDVCRPACDIAATARSQIKANCRVNGPPAAELIFP
jgi:1-deoxy-D-xylulose-5-phosphate synthase